ncbi:MAG: hypothetical protein ACXWRE_15190 [Pseudobdellovibrionaceae bacterium]
MKSFKISFFIFLLWGPLACPLLAAASEVAPYNQEILNILKGMPKGGGYKTNALAMAHLKAAITFNNDSLEVTPERGTPSFCSSATYLVFLKLISVLYKNKTIILNEDTQKALLVHGESDGSGVWGRWNSNGPGTARIFYELKLGRNFTFEKISDAQPGDFMKIFWSDEIGAKERGHSVIFTGTRQSPQGRQICFWSSNLAILGQGGGMGQKCVAEEKIHRAVFSRFEFPERLNEVASKMIPGSATYSDPYLSSLLERSSSSQEMCHEVGCL